VAGSVEMVVTDLVNKVIQNTEFELVDVEYKKEGSEWYLRVYIDHPDGIGLNDCEQISRSLGDLLDKEDPVPNSYFLEVSSPGIERPLKKEEDFKKYVGYNVVANTYGPIDGKKRFQGKLLGLKNENQVAISEGANITLIPLNKISLIHLSVE